MSCILSVVAGACYQPPVKALEPEKPIGFSGSTVYDMDSCPRIHGQNKESITLNGKNYISIFTKL
jgi:hypothetical protein